MVTNQKDNFDLNSIRPIFVKNLELLAAQSEEDMEGMEETKETKDDGKPEICQDRNPFNDYDILTPILHKETS